MGPLSRAVISSVVVLAAGREALAVERPATGPCHAAFVAPSPAGGALARAMRPRSRDVSALKCQGGSGVDGRTCRRVLARAPRHGRQMLERQLQELCRTACAGSGATAYRRRDVSG